MSCLEKYFLKIKEYIKNMDNNKLIYKLLAVLIIGIIILIIANVFTSNTKKVDNDLQASSFPKDVSNADLEYGVLLEEKLEEILSKLKGVGDVKVMITLEDTVEKIPAFNTSKNNETTNEVDSQGGTRETIREGMDIQMLTGSEGSLMILKEIKPTVRGVIVIAQGAEDPEIKEMLYDAVKTVLGIPGNRVEVYSSK